MTADVLDLFMGAGGTAEGARLAGLSSLGVEWDATACATARAAGHAVVEGDVSLLQPLDYAGPVGLIGTPPCQGLSNAGKQLGRGDMKHCAAAARSIAAGRDTRAYHAKRCADARSILIVEPLRWAVALEPEWIMLEQVPAALPFWQLLGTLLKKRGYSVWAGVLSAERFGVPQTRRRAILLASRTRPVGPPVPSHQAYVNGEPAREEHTLEGVVLPWVSMAEALGWGMTQRPSHTITAGGTGSGGGVEVFASADVRKVVERERAAGRWLTTSQSKGDWEQRRPVDAPAPALTAEARSQWFFVNGNQERATVRGVDEPASTIAFGHNADRVEWVEEPPDSVRAMGNTKGGTRPEGIERPVTDPGFTVTSRADQMEWCFNRPATTIAGDPRVHPPGHKQNASDPPGKYDGRAGKNAVRVEVHEAAVLQSFRADYPFQGSRTAQFGQVGNAVPPLLAAACIRVLAV